MEPVRSTHFAQLPDVEAVRRAHSAELPGVEPRTFAHGAELPNAEAPRCAHFAQLPRFSGALGARSDAATFHSGAQGSAPRVRPDSTQARARPSQILAGLRTKASTKKVCPSRNEFAQLVESVFGRGAARLRRPDDAVPCVGAFGLFHPDGARTSSIFYQAVDSYGLRLAVWPAPTIPFDAPF